MQQSTVQHPTDSRGYSPVRHIDAFSRQNKENLPNNLSGGEKLNQKKPYRASKNDGSFRHKLGFHQVDDAITNKSLGCLFVDLLSRENHWLILRFLTPHEIHTKINLLSRYFRSEVKSTKFWISFHRHHPLNLFDKYIKTHCLVERRQKGKLFEAVSVLNNRKYTQRIVDLMVSNANCDDGLPPSLTREISYLKTLPPHENINQLVEVEVFKNNNITLIFDYQPFTLKDIIKQRKNQEIDNQFCRDTMRQVAKAIHFLHSQGIMHRNIKPENILLTSDFQVKLSDFNLSRLVQGQVVPYTPEDPKDRERSGRESKRLWYRAPELLLRRNLYHHEIDVWSFGCVLAELALNEPLFSGENEIAQLFQTFQFLGSPTEIDWRVLSDDAEKKVKFPQWTQFPLNLKKIKDWERFKSEMIENRQPAYNKLLKLNQVLGETGIDLLERCLRIQSCERAHFQDIVKHPWLNPKHLLHLPHYKYESPPAPTFTNYIPTLQPNITTIMRSILVDWLIDVATHFDLRQETLHLAVTYTDLALSLKPIEKNKLQLIGVTSMKMADVYNERSREFYKQENCQEYSYITADEYTGAQLIAMEKELVKALDFRLTYTTTAHLVKQFPKNRIPTHVILAAEFFCDFFLQIYETLDLGNHIQAAGFLFLGYVIGTEVQCPIDIGLVTFSQEQFIHCVKSLRAMWMKWKADPQTNAFDAVHQKYLSMQTRSFNIQYTPEDVIKFYGNITKND